MDLKSSNIVDIFDSSVNFERIHFDDGYKDGYADGMVPGKQEGREVGLKHGFEIGEELGFYRGCIDVWNSAIGIDATPFSARVQKNIKQMEELVDNYPLLDPENESVEELIDRLRLKFRVFTESLKVRLEYEGYSKFSDVKDTVFWKKCWRSMSWGQLVLLISYLTWMPALMAAKIIMLED